MNARNDSSLIPQKSTWLSVAILAAMSAVLLALAVGARIEEGRFVYRTYLLLAAGIGAMVMALALRFRK